MSVATPIATSRRPHAIASEPGIAFGKVLVRGPAGVSLEQRPARACPAGFAQLRMRVAGICRTDVYAAAGAFDVPLGRVLGHEGCATVESCEDAPQLEGTRVAILPLRACGHCVPCQRATPCAHPQMMGVQESGLFAQVVQLPITRLLSVPAALDDRHAAFVEPAAAALALRNAALPFTQPGLVIGRGRIAKLAIRILRSLGAKHLQHLRADAVLSAEQRSAFGWCVECTATRKTMQLAVDAVRPRGTIVWKSRPRDGIVIDVAAAVFKGITIQAVDYAPFDEAAHWLAAHPQYDLMADTQPMAHYEQVFKRAAANESKKAFLSFSDDASSHQPSA